MEKNIKAPLKQSTTHGSPVHCREVNLSEIKGGYALIATTIEELNVMVKYNSVILIDSTERSTNGRAMNDKSRYLDTLCLHLCSSIRHSIGVDLNREENISIQLILQRIIL